MTILKSLSDIVLQNTTVEHYSDAVGQIADELHRLDLLIRRLSVKRRRCQEGDKLSRFGGLVLSDEQVERLLTETCADRASDPPAETPEQEIALLDDEIRACELRIRGRRYVTGRDGIDLPLSRLARLFNLSPFEESCLVVSLAPELDPRYERLYGYLHDDMTRKLPTPYLVMELLSCRLDGRMEARGLFDPSGPIFRHRLVTFAGLPQEPPLPLISQPLKIDERTAGFLLGSGAIDPQLRGSARLAGPDGVERVTTLQEEDLARLRAFVLSGRGEREARGRNLVLHLHGADGTGRGGVARKICDDLGIPLLLADATRFPESGLSFAEWLERLRRESEIRPCALCLENIDTLFAAEAGDLHRSTLALKLDGASFVTFLIGSSRWQGEMSFPGDRFLSVELPLPDPVARKELLESEIAGRLDLAERIDCGALAGRFRFTPGQIRDAVAMAGNLARWRCPEDPVVYGSDLFAACRDRSNRRLAALARKIEPVAGWDDLVLPVDQTAQLKELCNQARYRHTVYGEWGFERKISYGTGLNALFSGPPGTGKTMAAEVIARELGLDLYKIDLSQVVSKYIGETEKNLDRIFSEARTSNAILFFDEADALFGKRSEVKDAHDRYANIEIAYLLQKMEEYEGVAILATNLRSNMDPAFVRRLHFLVEFPLPPFEERRRIWAKVWPEGAPLHPDVDLDSLARRFEIAGGNIRNVALAAAFLAADQGGGIGTDHLLRAARREFQKMGKIVNETEFGDQELSS